MVVKLDSRGTFISNRNARFLGVKLGLEHGERFQYGIGYSFLISRVEGDFPTGGGHKVPVRLRLGYVCPYVEYAFYQRGHWEVRIPVQLGFGNGSLVQTSGEAEGKRVRRAFVFFYEPAMTVQYRFLRYFGVHAGWGLRLAVTNAGLGERLTAPIYTYGIKVFFSDLWRDIHP